jgi:hemerythrin-like domain-containing protein
MVTGDEMARGAASAMEIDTTEMVVVHRVFRRELRMMPILVEAAGDDREQVKRVAAHAREVFDTLHHHHTGEDELLWPRLRERAELDAELIGRMESQHAAIGVLLEDVDRLLPAWAASPDGDNTSALVSVLTKVSSALDEHLAEEEQRVLPLAARHITQEEWGQLGERGMASLPRDRIMVLLGYILEEADEAERRMFMAHVPLPGRVAYKLIGQRKYQREASALRRGIEPARGRV